MPPTSPETLAAVDLGSNSFHLLVARLVDGRIVPVDRVKERVALASGLGPDKHLAPDAIERALACLERFGQRLRYLPGEAIRIVGTNALRKARNRDAVVEPGSALLGHPIEVISGQEEARLIYLGVAHTFQTALGRRLVVDIGGGSTGIVVGEGTDPMRANSLYMGHISFSEHHFPDGRITPERMQEARVAAGLELSPVEQRFRSMGWQQAVGSSGTIQSIREVLLAQGWTDNLITPAGLSRLQDAMLDAGHTDALRLDGLDEARRPVLPGGFAILAATFEHLGIASMAVSEGALREGIFFDLSGRLHQADTREATVSRLMARFDIDTAQAARVERTALDLLEQVAESWDLEAKRHRRLLSWAARLHEVGLAMSLTSYHKHGHYLLAQSDLPGFSRDRQRELATLVLVHRRKLRAEPFEHLPPEQRVADLKLAMLLRIAVRLHRGRDDGAVPPVRAMAHGQDVWLTFPGGWLAANPLTAANLAREQDRLASAVPYRLTLADEG